MGIILETWSRLWRRLEARPWSRGASMTGVAGAAGTAYSGNVSGLGSEALLAFQCAGGGTERSKGSLE